jgi:hypothetical protein
MNMTSAKMREINWFDISCSGGAIKQMNFS